MEVSDGSLHPNPQFARARWVDLGGLWGFTYDDEDRGLAEGWNDRDDVFDREIVVPYPPESKSSGIHDTGFHPVVWYRRVVECARPDDGRVLLTFGAVDYRANVWVNGHRVGDHEGGNTSFTLDVTAALSGEGTAQVIVVRAEDWHDDVTQPRGKQDWRRDPHVIWYHRTTGIWQPVWMEVVSSAHLVHVDLTPDLVRGCIDVEAELPRPLLPGLALRCRIRHQDEVLADTTVAVSDPRVRVSVDLPAARNGQDAHRIMWQPDSPNLLDVDLLLERNGAVVDEVRSYTGFRSVGYADGHFLLNGHPCYLRLVLGQNYWPESHLAAPTPEALRREVELIKELGFNGVRIHQKVEDPRFLYWCDKLGLLAWGEMASAYTFSPTTVEQFTREWLDVVRRDRSHPCIVTWVPLNESWGFHMLEADPAQRHFASAVYHLTKALDPTRPAISNDGWEHTESDIWGVHDYGPSGRGLSERYGTADAVRRSLREGRPGRRRVLLLEGDDRGQPVVITEFGGVSFVPDAGEEWFAYSTVRTADELVAKLAELVDALLDSPHLAGFCYTQLTDTEQETNGLLTADRQPKAPLAAIRAVLTRAARSDAAEEVDRSREEGRADG